MPLTAGVIYLVLCILAAQLGVLLQELRVFVSDELFQLDHQLFQVGQPLHGIFRCFSFSGRLALTSRDFWHQHALYKDTITQTH